MFKSDLQKLRNALEFTRIYKENSGDIYTVSYTHLTLPTT